MLLFNGKLLVFLTLLYISNAVPNWTSKDLQEELKSSVVTIIHECETLLSSSTESKCSINKIKRELKSSANMIIRKFGIALQNMEKDISENLKNTYSSVLTGIQNSTLQIIDAQSTDIMKPNDVITENNADILAEIRNSSAYALDAQLTEISTLKEVIIETNADISDTLDVQSNEIALLKDIIDEQSNEISTLNNTLAITYNILAEIRNDTKYLASIISQVPYTPESVLSTTTPVPSTSKSVTSTFESFPSIHSTPEPVSSTPESVPSTPESVPSTPGPVPPTTTTVPSTPIPVPSTTTPVPSTPRPVPSTTTPVTSTPRPVPSTTAPVPSTTTSVHSTSRPVPSGFTTYNGTRIVLLPDAFGGTPLIWQESIDRCTGHGATPFIPRNLDDFRYLQQVNLGMSGSKGIWLPASDQVSENNLKWFDGSDASSTLRLFAWDRVGGYANDNNDSVDCVNMWTSFNHELEMENCLRADIMPMICELVYE